MWRVKEKAIKEESQTNDEIILHDKSLRSDELRTELMKSCEAYVMLLNIKNNHKKCRESNYSFSLLLRNIGSWACCLKQNTSFFFSIPEWLDAYAGAGVALGGNGTASFPSAEAAAAVASNAVVAGESTNFSYCSETLANKNVEEISELEHLLVFIVRVDGFCDEGAGCSAEGLFELSLMVMIHPFSPWDISKASFASCSDFWLAVNAMVKGKEEVIIYLLHKAARRCGVIDRRAG